MALPDVRIIGPDEHKPPTTTSYKILRRWGAEVGDVSTYTVSRTGERVRISTNVTLDLDLPTARLMHEVLGKLLEIEDE